MMKVPLNLNISISGTKVEKLNVFFKILGKVYVGFSFLSFIRISYPSYTSYGKTAQLILNSLIIQTEKVCNGRDRVVL